jgi:hypothetical protein
MPLSGWLTPESGVLVVLISFPLALRECVVAPLLFRASG